MPGKSARQKVPGKSVRQKVPCKSAWQKYLLGALQNASLYSSTIVHITKYFITPNLFKFCSSELFSDVLQPSFSQKDFVVFCNSALLKWHQIAYSSAPWPPPGLHPRPLLQAPRFAWQALFRADIAAARHFSTFSKPGIPVHCTVFLHPYIKVSCTVLAALDSFHYSK